MRGDYNRTSVSKCYIAVLIQILFEFTRFSKLQNVVKIEFQYMPAGGFYPWGILTGCIFFVVYR